MGSNSFRLEVGRVEGNQIFPLDTWRESLRMGAGLDDRGRLTSDAQRRALACLARFAERLRGLHPSAVRALATNVFRVAKNADAFLRRAEATLGFPIDVITGQEEARLIYAGVAHVLPAEAEPRLVIDIGGGSTEFIVGRGMVAERLDSLPIGCVSMTQRFFATGRLSAAAFRAAETAAHAEIEAIASTFAREHWDRGYASSGTALALADILEQNAFSRGITHEGLSRLRKAMIDSGNIRRLDLVALKSQRAPVLAGGLAIMIAAMEQLEADRIEPIGGAMRLGALYDLLGRSEHHDARAATIEQFLRRYHVDRAHAERVATLAVALYGAATPDPHETTAQRLRWAALLHEIGISVSHSGFHKHSAYILFNADMPGFAAGEQHALSSMVLACRGGLAKVQPWLEDLDFRATALALRLAVLFNHSRRPLDAPRLRVRATAPMRVQVDQRWRKAHPLSDHLLGREAAQWDEAGLPWQTR